MVAPTVLHDLSPLLEYRVIEVIKDGRRRNLASVFLIEARRKASPRGKKRKCVLKVVSIPTLLF